MGEICSQEAQRKAGSGQEPNIPPSRAHPEKSKVLPLGSYHLTESRTKDQVFTTWVFGRYSRSKLHH